MIEVFLSLSDGKFGKISFKIPTQRTIHIQIDIDFIYEWAPNKFFFSCRSQRFFVISDSRVMQLSS